MRSSISFQACWADPVRGVEKCRRDMANPGFAQASFDLGMPQRISVVDRSGRITVVVDDLTSGARVDMFRRSVWEYISPGTNHVRATPLIFHLHVD